MAERSPFPGMDPWLEQYWGDVHQRLVTYACDALQQRLPGGLRARMQERVFVEYPDDEQRAIYPDLRVVDHGRPGRSQPAGESGVAIAEPLVVHLDSEPPQDSFIEIIELGSGGKVITVIEVLSPANKTPGPKQGLYLQKQRELIQARVSLVEIDLVRTGVRMLSASMERLSASQKTTYQICVRRGHDPVHAEFYRAPLQEPLPTIGIPLRPTDPDAPLELQALVDLAYRNGRYEDMDHKRGPVPPLEGEDAAWADRLLKSKDLR